MPRGYMHPGWVDIPFARVKAGVTAYMAQPDHTRLEWNAHQPPRWIAEFMGLYKDPNTPSWPGYKFEHQAKRALDQLADENVLVKESTGTGRGSQVVYMTPAENDRRIAELEAGAREREAQRKRWVAVNDALDRNGIYSMDPPDRPVRLGLHSWEKLLGLVP